MIAKQNELMGRCSQIAIGLLCCGTKLSGRLRPDTCEFCKQNAHAKCIEVRKYLGVARGPFYLGIGRGTISTIAIAKQNE